MIYSLDTNVVAWFYSAPCPNRYLSILMITEIEACEAATLEPARQAHNACVLVDLRTEYRPDPRQ
jgi:hypothetical protein